MKDGVYVNLPAADYHRVKALSASGIKKLNISPLHFWWESYLNPDYVEPERTTAQIKGTMRHKFLLERDKFFDEYAIKPSQSNFSGVLVTADDLKGFMKEKNIKPLTGTKSEQISRIREAGHNDVLIWDEIVGNFEANLNGKQVVTEAEFKELKAAREMLDQQLILQGKSDLLSNGLAELTVIWTDRSGVRLKARFDFIKKGAIVDYKTFANQYEFPLDIAVNRAIQSGKYHFQSLMYLSAWEAAKNLELMDGTSESLSTLKEILSTNTLPTFTFLFQTSDGPYEVRIKNFRRYDPGKNTENVYWIKAREYLRNGVETFLSYSNHYKDKPWFSMGNIESDMNDLELPWIMNEAKLAEI